MLSNDRNPLAGRQLSRSAIDHWLTLDEPVGADDATGEAAIFGAVVVRLYPKFLDGVRVGQHVAGVAQPRVDRAKRSFPGEMASPYEAS